MTVIFAIPAAQLVIAVLANWFAHQTRVPDLIVLLLVGIALGPVLGWVDPSHFQNAVRILGTLALMLILFEGGLELRIRDAIRNLPGAFLLALVSFGLSMGLVACVFHMLLHIDWLDGLLVGAALGSTSGSVVLPVLQQIEASEPAKISLTLEASLGEVIAVIVVGTLLAVEGTSPSVSGLVVGFSRHVFTDIAIGIVVGLLWSRVWPRIVAYPFVNALNLGVVLAVFSLARYLGGSGLLAELVFGLTLANLPRTPHMSRQGARMVAFHSDFTFLVRSFFFVLLGIMAQVVERRYVVPIIAILVSLLLARFLAVRSTLWSIRGATAQDAELLFLMMPRGLITAVLALEIAADKGASFAFLPAMAFTAVLATNLLVVAAAVRSRRTDSAIAGPAELTAAALAPAEAAVTNLTSMPAERAAAGGE